MCPPKQSRGGLAMGNSRTHGPWEVIGGIHVRTSATSRTCWLEEVSPRRSVVPEVRPSAKPEDATVLCRGWDGPRQSPTSHAYSSQPRDPRAHRPRHRRPAGRLPCRCGRTTNPRPDVAPSVQCRWGSAVGSSAPSRGTRVRAQHGAFIARGGLIAAQAPLVLSTPRQYIPIICMRTRGSS